jgi:hypothetical protein
MQEIELPKEKASTDFESPAMKMASLEPILLLFFTLSILLRQSLKEYVFDPCTKSGSSGLNSGSESVLKFLLA